MPIGFVSIGAKRSIRMNTAEWRRTKRRTAGAAAALLILPYLTYRALWGEPMQRGGLVPLAAILVVLFFLYAAHCFRILRRSRTDRREWMRFVLVSVVVLAATLLNFASIYRVVGLVPPSQEVPPAATQPPICTDAGACLYFAVITWTTVGYGDFTPTPAARPYAALEAIVGYMFMAFFVPTLIYATNVLGRPTEDPAELKPAAISSAQES
ncbi:MAG: two pore domain potassium channel family protein [Planctomycetes bacterium]|nr:two pore domain potassium channel family protein [Planctomycetota bacterium]